MPKVNPKTKSVSSTKLNAEIREVRIQLQLEKENLKNTLDRKRRFEKENSDLEINNDRLKRLNRSYSDDRMNLSTEITALKEQHKKLENELGFRRMDLESKEAEVRKVEDKYNRWAVELAKEDDRLKELAREIDIKRQGLDYKERQAIAEQETAQELSRQVTKRLNALEIDEKKFQRKLEHIKDLEEGYKKKISEIENVRVKLQSEIMQYGKKIKDVEKEEAEVVKTRAKMNIAIDEANIEKAAMIKKQQSLTANIRELKNEENRIEIVRLRVVKMINDNKDIKELESLRKELLTDNLTKDKSQ